MSVEATNLSVEPKYLVIYSTNIPITHAVRLYHSIVQLLRERTRVIASATFGSGEEAAAACSSTAAALCTWTSEHA